MKDLKQRFWNWKGALGSKGLKVNTRKTKVMVSELKELFKSKIDPREVCGRRVMANSVLYKNVEIGLSLGWQCILFARNVKE